MTTATATAPFTYAPLSVHLPLRVHVLSGVKLKASIWRLAKLVAREGSPMHDAYLAIAQRRRTQAMAAIATVWARPLDHGLDIGSALITDGIPHMMVWVDSHARRQGVGTKLVRMLLEQWVLYGRRQPSPLVWRGSDGAANFWATFGKDVT